MNLAPGFQSGILCVGRVPQRKQHDCETCFHRFPSHKPHLLVQRKLADAFYGRGEYRVGEGWCRRRYGRLAYRVGAKLERLAASARRMLNRQPAA